MTDKKSEQHPDAKDLPDGSGSDGSTPQDGEDTASGGGADDK
ncbi:MAG: hypothetical protein ACHP7F_08980 [Actinomycetales bacterium]